MLANAICSASNRAGRDAMNEETNDFGGGSFRVLRGA
jgi:hypothetical protein